VGTKTISIKNMDKHQVFYCNRRENKQNKLTAKQYKANAMEEQTEATEELIANLKESQTRQMEILIKNTTKAMKEMTL
jgi:hypothetical protein